MGSHVLGSRDLGRDTTVAENGYWAWRKNGKGRRRKEWPEEQEEVQERWGLEAKGGEGVASSAQSH